MALKISVLDEAVNVTRKRRENYDDPTPNHERIAKIWSGILDREVTAEQVALCMIGLKLARESFLHGRDNLVDMAGYVDCLAEITKENPNAPAEEDGTIVEVPAFGKAHYYWDYEKARLAKRE